MSLSDTLLILGIITMVVIIYFYSEKRHQIKLHLKRIEHPDSIRDVVKTGHPELNDEIMFLKRISYFVIIPIFLLFMTIILRLQ